MGDPKFPRRRYDTPSHPWKAERIAAEKTLVRKYGLKNKREIWKAQTRLREFRGTARVLLSKAHTPTPQVTKESSELIARMNRIGLLRPGATLDDILGLDVENLLARRLQTVVYLKGLAGTPKQSRQFIVHGHVTVGGRRVTVPSYLVTGKEEEQIELNAQSAVADPAHPVRARPEAVAAPAERPARSERGERERGDRGGRGERGGGRPRREERSPAGPPAKPAEKAKEGEAPTPAAEGGES